MMIAIGLAWLVAACGQPAQYPVEAGIGPDPELPPPNAGVLPTVRPAEAIGWPAGETPMAADGLAVIAFADGLQHPRWLYVAANGDVLVAESNRTHPEESGNPLKRWVMGLVQKYAGAGVESANRITLLRDTDGDGVADLRKPLLEGLHSPFGMAIVGDYLYVANTDAVVRVPYQAGQTEVAQEPEAVAALPAGPINHHWTKNILPGADGQWLYVTVGSNSNVAENGMAVEENRAAILRLNLESFELVPYAAGLRNPNGLAWEPATGTLWTTVNERDEIGSDLVPDYLTSVREGGFYGWPYSYYGAHVDERVQPQRPERVAQALVPDYALGAHTASLGLAFSNGAAAMPERFAKGAFIGQHGSWNRKPRSGYKVIFVPFENGRPNGRPLDVLVGFLNDDEQARGRPAGVAIAGDGALLVADDVGNTIWRVAGQRP
ncbi:MAG: sorbosone dehydrogenase family protein [Burkholderiaceae bacterium]